MERKEISKRNLPELIQLIKKKMTHFWSHRILKKLGLFNDDVTSKRRSFPRIKKSITKTWKCKSKHRFKTIFLLLVIHLYLLNLIIGPITFAIRTQEYDVLFFNLADLTAFFVTVISCDVLFYHRYNHDKIVDCLNDLKRYKKSRDNLIEVLSIVVVAFYFLCHLSMVYWLVFSGIWALEGYSEVYFYSISLIYEVPIFGFIVCFIDSTIFIFVCSFLRPIMYVYSWFVLSSLNNRLSALLSFTEERHFKFRTAQSILKSHTILYKLSREIGTRFGILLALWLSDWMMTFTTNIPWILNDKNENSVVDNLLILFKLPLCLTSSFVISTCAGNISTFQSKFLLSLHKDVTRKNFFNGNGLVTSQYRLFLTKFRTGNIDFMVFKSFLITNLTIYNIYGYISGFAIYAYQVLMDRK